jgi:hypothetical protein
VHFRRVHFQHGGHGTGSAVLPLTHHEAASGR